MADNAAYIELFKAVAPVTAAIAGSLAAAVGLATFWWNNLRLIVRQQAVIDLATKQAAFWKQTLELELLANESNEQAKQIALHSLERIRSRANVELTRIAWASSIGTVLRSEPALLFRVSPPNGLGVFRRVLWSLLKLSSIGLWIIVVLILLLSLVFALPDRNPSSLGIPPRPELNASGGQPAAKSAPVSKPRSLSDLPIPMSSPESIVDNNKEYLLVTPRSISRDGKTYVLQNPEEINRDGNVYILTPPKVIAENGRTYARKGPESITRDGQTFVLAGQTTTAFTEDGEAVQLHSSTGESDESRSDFYAPLFILIVAGAVLYFGFRLNLLAEALAKPREPMLEEI
jgi:hypothetical protein